MTVAPEDDRGRTAAAAGTWAERDFVDRWIAGDSMSRLLELPRRLTAALVRESEIDVCRVVDVGAGSGSYLRTLLDEFPDAQGIWIDASEAMRERAETALADLGDRVTFHLGDLRHAEALPLAGDVVLSSRAVHHFLPETIERFYAAAAGGLPPGGCFANLDHFAPPGDWRPRYEAVRPSFVGAGGDGAPHSHDAPPQPIDAHLAWLRRAGFAAPDVPWRFLMTALVVAHRPA